MNITIVGAGNVGTQIAAHCAEKGNKVTIYGSHPKKINNILTVINQNDEIIHQGVIDRATNSEEEAFAEADLIFVCMPATLMKYNAEKIEPYARTGMKICLVPGTGGGECAFNKCIKNGAVLFGVQRVPSVARLLEYGKTVRAVGYRKEMFVASIPSNRVIDCCEIISDIFEIKTSALPNYLNITLTPSNPILHTTRLRCIYNNWHDGVVYDSVPLFYEDWNNETSELLFKCDEEVQNICHKLKELDLSYVKSLSVHYESPTVKDMTKKIRSIDGFKGLTSPAVKVFNGYIPDFESRYFTSDFSYGLAILVQIAEFAGVDVPNMRNIMEWYYKIANNHNEYRYTDYGIYSREDFLKFYKV